MQEHAEKYSIGKMAKLFQVSVRGFYSYKNRTISSREKENQKLFEQIEQIYQEGRGVYGSPRIHGRLVKRGISCSRKRVARIMKSHGIASKLRKCWKRTTRQGKREAFDNHIQQEFYAHFPNQKWVSDISYVCTKEGWLYVAAVLDLFSRKIVGFSMQERLDASLVERALSQALCHRNPPQGIIHHSDRGCQYTSQGFVKLAKKNGILLSMSSTGNCYDNAAMESFFHTLKTEHVYQNKFATREEARRSLFEYVEVFYNRKRAHSFLEYLSPEEFEQNGSKQVM